MTAVPSTQCISEAGTSRHYILGTAGHIDHGKTSLVRALTGTDTDRLPEERRRGMTIELGFAALQLGDARFGIVDVPGHERFVRTMVAGATGIDLALIVVAADDSVMPQTVEHVEILHLLGVFRAVVAITKIDMVENDMVELVTGDVQQLLAGTPLENAPICPVSSATGAGMEALTAAILSVSDKIARTASPHPFRMAVDRVFTVQGRGTVVTGSVFRGQVAEGDTLEIWPLGDTCRVRGLQTHGVDSPALTSGQRAAINVSGVDRGRLQRGVELATPGYITLSRIINVRLLCLSSLGRPIKSTSVVRLEIGTTEVPVRVVFIDGNALEPGASAYAQFRSAEPLVATYGQRFIIRDQNATRTIGGGMILGPLSRRRRGDKKTELDSLQRLENGDTADRVEEVLRLSGFTRPTDLQLCARAGVEWDELPEILEQLRTARRWVPIAGTQDLAVPAAVDDLARRLSGWLERYHRSRPELPGRHIDSVLGWLERMTSRSLTRPLFDLLVRNKTLKLLGRFVCMPDFAPSLSAADEKLMAAMIDEIRTGGFQPPSIDGLAGSSPADRKRRERLATLAAALGEVIKIDPKIYLDTQVERQLRQKVADLIARRGPVTVAQVREALNSSRKYVVPFLEYLDRTGFTKRVGDHRILVGDEHD